MPFRGTQDAFSFGVNVYEKGRIGQPDADGAAFFLDWSNVILEIWPG
jgi:hypothetical protein